MGRGILLNRVVLLLLVVLATALRAYRLGWQSLLDDEGFTAAILGHDVWRIAAETPLGNLPLHYFLVGVWTAASGYSEFALRYVSLWFGVLLVPLTYLLGGKLFGTSARLPAALLMTVAPSFIYHSQNARPYTLLTVLFLANFLFALKLLERPGTWWLWLGLIATAVLGSYTHFFGMVLPLLAILVFLPHALRDRRFLYGICCTGAGAILLLSPWLVGQLAGNAGYARRYLSAAPLAEVSLTLVRAGQVWVGLFAQTSYVLEVGAAHIWALLPLMVLCSGLVLLCRRHTFSIRFAVLVYLLVPLATGLLAGTLFTFFNPRFLIYLAPLCYALIAGIGVWRWHGSHLVAPAAVGAILLLWLPVTKDYYENTVNDDLRSLARRVTAETREGDAIVVNSGWRNTLLDYYLRGSSGLPRYVIPLERPLDEGATRAGLSEVISGHERVWVVFFGAPPSSGTHAIGPVLSERFARVVDQWYGTTRLGLYVKGKTANEDGELATFKNELELRTGPLHWPENGKPLDSAVISLDWRPLHTLTNNYAASLRLVDKDEIIWSQSDGAPRNGHLQTAGRTANDRWREYRGLLVPAGTPPGTYTMTLTIYNVANGQPLEPIGNRSLGRRGALVLGRIRVGVADRQPELATLPLTAKKYAVFAQQLALLGGQWPDSQMAGQSVGLQLYWQGLRPMAKDYRVNLRLRDRLGHIGGEVTAPISGPEHPTSLWTTGSVLKGQYRLPIAPRLTPGEYALHISVIDPQSGASLATADGAEQVAGYVEVRAQPRPVQAPPMSKQVDATFGPGLTLLGYTLESGKRGANDLSPSPGTGRSAKVTLYWSWLPETADDQAAIDRSYTTFVHLLNQKGALVSQHDGIPGNGHMPTTAWVRNEVVADPHLIPVPTELQDGPFTFIAGLYDSKTIERLATGNDADHVRLEEVGIEDL